MPTLENFYLANLYTVENNALLARLQPLLSPAYPAVVELFYSELLADKSASKFLDSGQVEKRLKADLQRWLTTTLNAKSGSEANEVVNLQRHVGEVHARIDVPMSVVDRAMSLVKNGCFKALLDKLATREEIYQAVLLVNAILEASLSIINEAYLHGLVENERHAQSFRSNISSQELVLEVERVRTDLFNWLSATTLDVMSGLQTRPATLAQSEFSLWITHKLELICIDQEICTQIKQLLAGIEGRLNAFEDGPRDAEQGRALCLALNKLVNDIAWQLSEIAKSVAADVAREDQLTRLFERKYLAPVMQKETRLALLGQSSYAVIMLDIDHFKSINDLYGHHVGDKVLSHVGQLLRRAVRISDYCFRYGGEEFLILLPECDAVRGRRIAEQIRQSLEQEAFPVDNGRTLSLSASFGVSEFVGHPDYMETVKAADAALYAAKHGGRNRTVVSAVRPDTVAVD